MGGSEEEEEEEEGEEQTIDGPGTEMITNALALFCIHISRYGLSWLLYDVYSHFTCSSGNARLLNDKIRSNYKMNKWAKPQLLSGKCT